MLSLQETTVHYMHQQFQPELFALLVDSCATLACFAVTQYEDDLVNLIAAEDLESDERRDRFVQRIRQALEDVVVEHMIALDSGAETTLGELNQLVRFLATIQDLEDTSMLQYRLHGAGTAKRVLLDVMSVYSQLNPFRAMEIVTEVDDKLIEAIRRMVEDKDEAFVDQQHHAHTWGHFLAFLGKDTPCLGIRLRQSGYFGLELAAMNALMTPTLGAQIDQTLVTSTAQAALDTLSVLMLCTNTYQDPLAALTEHAGELFSDPLYANRLRQPMSAMYTDFTTWLSATKPGLATQQDIAQ